MKKKEVLIIFILALLVTGLSGFYLPGLGEFIVRRSTGVYPAILSPGRGFPFGFLVTERKCLHLYVEGIKPRCGPLEADFYLLNAVLDFFFWFLVIFALWKIVKWIKARFKK